eukprot:699849_1
MVWQHVLARKSAKKSHQLKLHLCQTNPDLILCQESLGFRGMGYTKDREEGEYVDTRMHELIHHDDYDINSIMKRNNIEGIRPMNIGSDGRKEPKNVMHYAGVMAMIDPPINGRKMMAIISVYRPGAMDDLRSGLDMIWKQICREMQDDDPLILIQGDFNIWHEQIGSDPSKRRTDKSKFEMGDILMDFMRERRMVLLNDNGCN